MKKSARTQMWEHLLQLEIIVTFLIEETDTDRYGESNPALEDKLLNAYHEALKWYDPDHKRPPTLAHAQHWLHQAINDEVDDDAPSTD